jgi:hypothetical protein
MKIHSGHMQQHHRFHVRADSNIVPVVVDSFRETLALLSAVIAAIAIVMLSVWVAGMEIQNIFGAFTLGLGFVFLAMAVDSRESLAILQSVTGLSLLALAWLHNSVSPDFIIASGILVALWVAATLFRQLR